MINFKLEPYEHQLKIYNESSQANIYGYLAEQGTGKSKMLLDCIGRLAKEECINAAIIIAPNGVYRNWINKEIPEHFTDDIEYEIVEFKTSKTKTNTGKEELKRAVYFKEKFKFFVHNVEGYSTSAPLKSFTEAFLLNNKCLVAIDESTTIGNIKSNRTKYILSKIKPLCEYRRILTGTPMANSPLNLYSQFAFLGTIVLGFTSYTVFKRTIAIEKDIQLGNRIFKEVVGYKEDELKKLSNKIAKYACRVTKKECLDLPDKIYQDFQFEMSGDQLAAYQEMKTILTVSFEKEIFTSTTQAISKMIKLHEIACGFIMNETGEIIDFEKNPRMDSLLECLSYSHTGKTIIWANYKHNIKQLNKVLQKQYGEHKVVLYYGDTNMADREKAIFNFQHDKSTEFFIANPASAKYGITLNASSNTIYYSNSFDLEARQQSEDRNHRIGQKNKVVYTDIFTKGIDEKIKQTLVKKIRLQDIITTHGWKEFL